MAANDAGMVVDVGRATTVEKVRTALGDGVDVGVVTDFSNNETFTDAMLVVVAEMCPNLMSLDLPSCSNLTDAAVVAVAGGCPNLTSLELANCSNLTDAAVVAVAGGCPNLTSLTLRGCSNLTLHLTSARNAIAQPDFHASQHACALIAALIAALAPFPVHFMARCNALSPANLDTLLANGADLVDLDDNHNHAYVYSPALSAPVFASPMIESIKANGDGSAELANGVNKATLALLITLHAAGTIPFSNPAFAFLVNAGADINAIEPMLGLRPLHISVSRSNILATMALLAAGADVWALGANGETAMSISSAVLNKPGSDTNAAAKEVYSLIVNGAVPDRVARHVRASIAAGGDLGGPAGASAGPASRIDELEAKLASTEAELTAELTATKAELEAKLASTETELTATKAELATMQDLLTIATGNIAALQQDRASIIDHFDKAVAAFQATRR